MSMSEQLSFGRWLKQRRKALDLTQEALGQRVGCARITIQKFELDQRRPSQVTAERLAELLAVPLEERAAFIRFARALPDAEILSSLDSRQPLTAEPSVTTSDASALDRDEVAGKLRTVHQAIGDALETLYGDWAEQVAAPLAFHFAQAGLAEKAAAYLLLAGERAHRLSSEREAIQHLTHGLNYAAELPDSPSRTRQELAFHIALGAASAAVKGSAAEEVGRIYQRAQLLCRQSNDIHHLSAILNGLCNYYTIRGEIQHARVVAEEMVNLAQMQPDPIPRAAAHRALGNVLVWLGEFGPARMSLEQGITFYNVQHHAEYIKLYGHDTGVSCLTNLAMVLWMLGYPDQAIQRSHEALALAQTLSHPLSLAFATMWAGQLHWLRREDLDASVQAEVAIQLATEHEFSPVWACAVCCRGIALARQEEVEEGIDQIQRASSAWRLMGSAPGSVYFLLGLAEAHGRAGQAAQGMALIAEGLAAASTNGDRVWESELHRLQGDLRLMQGDEKGSSPSARYANAEASFRQAIDVARRQGAKSFELRATLHLCRLWQAQGRYEEARRWLAEIYGWFTEGFATPDLMEANALLVALA
jgi:transcriptional regulator with XRE-family HTH domain